MPRTPLTRVVARRLAYQVPALRRSAEERAALRQALTGLGAERDSLQQAVIDLSAERDALRVEHQALQAEQLTLTQVVAGLEAERDATRTLMTAVENTRQHLSLELDRSFAQTVARLGPQLTALADGQEIATARILRGFEQYKNGRSAHGFGVERYLELLELTLTGMIYGDAAIGAGSKGGYDPTIRAIGRDWPSRAHTMIGLARLRNLRSLCERALADEIPGDFIETGVWRGGACILMRGILDVYGDATRRVFVADSFCGLPPPDPATYPADAGDPHHTFQELAVSRHAVEENFRRYGLLDDRVVFLEGWFKDTLPAAPIDRLAVLRLDGDMYESTMQALEALYHKVSPGGFVIIDDYVLKRCAAAVDDFRAARGIDAPLHNIDDAAVWWRIAS